MKKDTYSYSNFRMSHKLRLVITALVDENTPLNFNFNTQHSAFWLFTA